MKKLFAAFLCVLALSAFQPGSAAAQSIGFKVGPTWSKIDVDPDEDTDNTMLTSFGGGGFVRFAFSGLALQLEVLAVTKGSKVEDPETDDDLQVRLGYIEVPLTAVFALGNGPYIFAGPAIGFEISCKAELTLAGHSEKAKCDDDAADIFERKKTDFGVVGGAGLQFRMGPGSLLVEGRYTHGLTNLVAGGGDDKVRNRSYAAFAGYAIPLSLP
jgi:Outer membrane protein beta-barrel domain